MIFHKQLFLVFLVLSYFLIGTGLYAISLQFEKSEQISYKLCQEKLVEVYKKNYSSERQKMDCKEYIYKPIDQLKDALVIIFLWPGFFLGPILGKFSRFITYQFFR